VVTPTLIRIGTLFLPANLDTQGGEAVLVGRQRTPARRGTSAGAIEGKRLKWKDWKKGGPALAEKDDRGPTLEEISSAACFPGWRRSSACCHLKKFKGTIAWDQVYIYFSWSSSMTTSPISAVLSLFFIISEEKSFTEKKTSERWVLSFL
jgi:hypothetical protein